MSHPDGFGRRLKQLRQEQGLTQELLAERVGCAIETIRKLESERRRPSFQMAARIAEVLQLEPAAKEKWIRAARTSPETGERLQKNDEETAAPRPQELPVYLTPFIGREQEQAILASLLEQPVYRLITLLGPGGAGKTRLAVEVARTVVGFHDGIFFVPLAPVTSAQSIVPALGAALGFNFSGPSDLSTQLLGFLAKKRCLLILDNLEHLLAISKDTLVLVERLLAQAPNITLLVTSRERLKLPGEWVRELTGLAVPPVDGLPFSASYPACALFAEHGQRTRPDFRLESTNRDTVAAICRMVDGMPLGIELAASWLRILSPEEIGQELGRNLDAQHLSPGTNPARHRSLWSVVDHSWNLLSDVEQEVLKRLSIFQGGFSREAAGDIAGADLLVLASLADKSLLRRKSDGRYDLHEFIRQYAAARLKADSGEHKLVRDRHAAFFCSWLGSLRYRLHSGEQINTLAAISLEIDNIRTAWRWAGECQLLSALHQAADTLQWFYEFRSWFAEATVMFSQVAEELRHGAQTADEVGLRHTLGEVLARLGFIAIRSGAIDLARHSIAEAIQLLHDCPDPELLAHAHVYQGMFFYYVGDYQRAQRALQSCRAAIPEGDQIISAFCDTWENMVALAQGDYEKSERFFRSGLARYRELEHDRGIVIATTFCSTSLISLGKYQELETLLHEGLQVAEILDDRYGIAAALLQLGLVAHAQNLTSVAIDHFNESLALFRMIGSQWDIVRLSNLLGEALMTAGKFTEAGKAFREAMFLGFELQILPEALQGLYGVARLFALNGQILDALEISACILSDRAASTKTREKAQHLRDELIAGFSVEKHALLERQEVGRSFSELVAALRLLPEQDYVTPV